MSKTPKHLCKWDKSDIKKQFKKYREKVKHPEFVCLNCGRAAQDKKDLCKPEAL